MPMTVSQYRKSYRDKGRYAWPGGYPVYLLLADGETLCHKCEKTERRSILDAANNPCHSGWEPEAHYILWEGDEDFCAHCGEVLESAYGPVEN
jgi:hypothetical protein